MLPAVLSAAEVLRTRRACLIGLLLCSFVHGLFLTLTPPQTPLQKPPVKYKLYTSRGEN